MNEKGAEYAEKIVHALSAQLQTEFGKGCSKRHLFNLIRFAEAKKYCLLLNHNYISKTVGREK